MPFALTDWVKLDNLPMFNVDSFNPLDRYQSLQQRQLLYEKIMEIEDLSYHGGDLQGVSDQLRAGGVQALEQEYHQQGQVGAELEEVQCLE